MLLDEVSYGENCRGSLSSKTIEPVERVCFLFHLALVGRERVGRDIHDD